MTSPPDSTSPSKRPKSSRGLGLAHILAGTVQFLAGALLLIIIKLHTNLGEFTAPKMVALMLAALLVGLGYRRVTYGRRLRSNEPDLDGTRPLALYLRPFGQDENYEDDQTVELFGTVPIAYPSFEQRIVAGLRGIGGAVATIGRPGDTLAPLGADRIYLPENADWPTVASSLICDATIIAMVAGRSAGIIRELEEVSRQRAFGKLVILIPPAPSRGPGIVDRCTVEEFVALLERILGRTLSRSEQTGNVLRFTADGEPIPVKARTSWPEAILLFPLGWDLVTRGVETALEDAGIRVHRSFFSMKLFARLVHVLFFTAVGILVLWSKYRPR